MKSSPSFANQRICRSALLAVTLLLSGSGDASAEFLFTGEYEVPTRESFRVPTLNYDPSYRARRYSEWDNFYSRYEAGNYPDVFAKFGGLPLPGGGWDPEPRPLTSDFPWSQYYNSFQPNAFWDLWNPTITQVGTSSALITGTNNIYSHAGPTSFILNDNTNLGDDAFAPGTVVFQFQTDGTLVDFSSIRLVYRFSNGEEGSIAATDLEGRVDYLREYKIHPTDGGAVHWSAGNGYVNRVAIQWNLEGIEHWQYGSIASYHIEWASQSSSMSLTQVALDVQGDYQEGLPGARIWQDGDGLWSDSNRWSKLVPDDIEVGGTTPVLNGNVRFWNQQAAEINLDVDHTVGELIFEREDDVTLSTQNNSVLKSNTGISTTEVATGVYTIRTDYQLEALNVFELEAGKVVLEGTVSGNYGIAKSGAGELVLAADNTFTGFLGIGGGVVRIQGNNLYSGDTTLLDGELILEGDALVNEGVGSGVLGTSTTKISVGADAGLYAYVGGTYLAKLVIEGSHRMERDIALAGGDNAKELGAVNTGPDGAVFSGAIGFTRESFDPEAPEPEASSLAAGNVKLFAQGQDDKVRFTGTMTGGHRDRKVTIDGAGTVAYGGAIKTYFNSTEVHNGALHLENGSGYTGNGDFRVAAGAALWVDGVLGGTGALSLDAAATLGGAGTISRDVSVSNGARLAPGQSPGTLTLANVTWGGGGILEWEIADAEGIAGVDWDFLVIGGDLNLTATSEDRFIFSLASLTPSLDPGSLVNFDPERPEGYLWHVASIAGEVSWGGGNFEDLFQIDASGFSGAGGLFAIELREGKDVYLTYTAVPEPGAITLGGIGLILAAARWMRRRKA